LEYIDTHREKDMDNIISSFSEKYKKSDIVTSFQELESSGLLKEESLREPVLPTSLQGMSLSLTRTCNLQCRYCFEDWQDAHYYRSSPEKVGKKAVDFLLEYSRDNKKLLFTFFGGEPMLRFDDIKEITEYAYSKAKELGKEMLFSIDTNGTIINDEVIELFKKYRFSVVVSMDGPQEVQDINRPFKNGKGSYKLVERNIKKMVKELGGRFGVKVTVCPQYLDLVSIVESIAKLGVREISLSPVVSFNKNDTYYFDKADWNRYLVEFKKLIWAYPDLFKKYGLILSRVSVTMHDFLYPHISKTWGCNAGKTTVSVEPAGDLYPCDNFVGLDKDKYCIGNLSTGFNSNRERFLNVNYKTTENCPQCFMKYLCGGSCYWMSANEYDEIGRVNLKQCKFEQEIFTEILDFYLYLSHNDENLFKTLSLESKESVMRALGHDVAIF